jgi:biotin carboxyl carrier protein
LTADIALHGTRHTVDARRDGDRWIVTLGGRELGIDIVEIGGRWSMLIGGAAGSGSAAAGIGSVLRSFEVVVEPRGASGYEVFVNGAAFPLTIADPRNAFIRRSAADSDRPAVGGSTKVFSPMPGRVVKVLVAPGEAVTARQPLVIIEAMKMENELRAPRAGTVSAVQVSEGQLVEAHAVLVVME